MDLNRIISLIAITLGVIAILFTIVREDQVKTLAYQKLEGMVHVQTQAIKDLRQEVKKLKAQSN